MQLRLHLSHTDCRRCTGSGSVGDDDQMLSAASEVWLGGEKLRRGGSAGKRAARSDRGGTHTKARRSIASHLTEADVAELDAGLTEAITGLGGDLSDADSLAENPGFDLDS